MKKQNKATFEEKFEELENILLSLKKGDLGLKEIKTQIKLAKETYTFLKEELEATKLIISEIKENDEDNK